MSGEKLLGSIMVTLSDVNGKVNSLVGNGQPGRIAILEQKVEDHTTQLAYWKGAVAVLTFLLLLLGGTEVWQIVHNVHSATP